MNDLVIKIDNDEKDKLRKIREILVNEGFARFSTQKEMADWLGISSRTLRYWLVKYVELHKFKAPRNFFRTGNEKWRRYEDK